MSERYRIVIVVPDCGEGGLFQFYNQFVPELARHAEVHVIFSSPFCSLSIPAIAGAQCHVLQAENAAPVLAQLLQGPLAIAPGVARALAVAHNAWRKALELAPDCIEMCDWPLSFAPAVLAQSIPCVVQCHGSMGQIAEHDPLREQMFENALVQLIEPQLMATAQFIQSYSEQNASFWTRTANRPVQMIRPAFVLPDRPCDIDGISENAAVLGRLQRWKGPHILCEALRRLGATGPAVDWYGGLKPWDCGDQLADRFLAGAFPDVWGSRFHHRPAVPRSTVAEIQARALFNIVPSTWDVFNFTAVEAMAAARPLIVSKGAGASELVIDGDNGFTFENGNSESLAAAIDRVLTLPEKRRVEIGQAGRETVRVELNPALIAEQRMAAYGEAIQSFVSSPPSIPNSWLADFIDPSSDRMVNVGDLLEGLPITSIARHMRDRMLRKFR